MSSMPITLEKLQQLIQCSICLETFRAPKALKCLHTFCEDCLNTTVKVSHQEEEAGFKCPECRSFTATTNVTNNVHMVQLIELCDDATKPKICVFCEREEGKWKCSECVEIYCDSCKVGHLKQRASRSHQFVSLEEAHRNLMIDQPTFCAKHSSETLKYSCKECNILLCVTCALVDHDKDHAYKTIDDALKVCMPYVQDLIDQVNAYSDNVKAREDALKTQSIQVQARFDISKRLALERRQEVISKAEADFKSTIANLTKIKDEEQEKLGAAMILENAKYKETLSSIDYAENTILTSSGAHLLREMQQNVLPKLKDIIARERPTHELPIVDYPFYQPCKADNPKISCIGKAAPIAYHIPSLYRFKDIDFAECFSTGNLKLENTVDIDLQKEAKGYRVCVGFGKVMISLWNIATIVIYTSEGKHDKTINNLELENPKSACFLDEHCLAIASNSGLHLFNIRDEQNKKLSSGKYSDVQSFNNTLYALRYEKASIVIATKAQDWASATVRSIDIRLGTILPASTLVVTSSRIYVSNCKDTVHEFDMQGEKIRTINVEMKKPLVCAANLDGDVIVVDDVGNKETQQYIIRSDKTIPFEIPGVKWTNDVAFQDENNIFVLEVVSVKVGKYKLHHFKRK